MLDSAGWQNGAASWCLRMGRNLVLIRLCRADKSGLARMRRSNFPVFKNENFAAPVDSMGGKAAKPDAEGDQIAQRHQPQVTPYGAVMHYSDSHLHRHGGPKSRGGGQRTP